jgi:hypothetical protein
MRRCGFRLKPVQETVVGESIPFERNDFILVRNRQSANFSSVSGTAGCRCGPRFAASLNSASTNFTSRARFLQRGVGMEGNVYLKARQEWDERYADLVLGKRN